MKYENLLICPLDVVPDRLQKFLGADFDWLRPDTQATPDKEEKSDDRNWVEIIQVTRDCEYCNRKTKSRKRRA